MHSSDGIDLLIIVAALAFMLLGGHYVEWRKRVRETKQQRLVKRGLA